MTKAAASSRSHQVNQRALLFGSRLGHGPEAERRGREVAESKRLAAEERTLIEARSDELVEELHDKIGDLRAVTLQIGHETSASLSMLDDMDQSFGGALQVLRRTNDRLQVLAKEPAGQNLIRMSLFCVALFFFLYFFSPRISVTSLYHGAKSTGSFLGKSHLLPPAVAAPSGRGVNVTN